MPSYTAGLMAALIAAAGFAGSPAFAQGQMSGPSEAKVNIGDNLLFAKGGIGLVRRDLYVVVNSKNNELRLGAGKSWVGMDAQERQVIFVRGQDVIVTPDLPKEFKLEDSVVVSFQTDRIVFYDFASGSGGFYRRTPN